MGGSAQDAISNFMHDNENIEDTWKVYTRNPFSMAYERALGEFQTTLENQKKADAWKLELMTLAFSMCGGGIMTAAFGTMAIKTILADKALSVICNNNMEKAFKVAHFVSTNKTANFIAGKAWDEIEARGTALVTKPTLDSLAQTVEAFPSTDSGKMTSFSMDKTLENFLGEAKIKAHNIAKDIRDNSKLTDDEKITQVEKLRESAFFKAPTKNIDDGSLADDLELSFYLQMVLRSDYIQNKWGQNRDIEVEPDSPNYPKAGKDDDGLFYHQLGGEIALKLNKLYEKKFKTGFFDNVEKFKQNSWVKSTYGGKIGALGEISSTEMRRAQQALGNLTSFKIKQLIEGTGK